MLCIPGTVWSHVYVRSEDDPRFPPLSEYKTFSIEHTCISALFIHYIPIHLHPYRLRSTDSRHPHFKLLRTSNTVTQTNERMDSNIELQSVQPYECMCGRTAAFRLSIPAAQRLHPRPKSTLTAACLPIDAPALSKYEHELTARSYERILRRSLAGPSPSTAVGVRSSCRSPTSRGHTSSQTRCGADCHGDAETP